MKNIIFRVVCGILEFSYRRAIADAAGCCWLAVAISSVHSLLSVNKSTVKIDGARRPYLRLRSSSYDELTR